MVPFTSWFWETAVPPVPAQVYSTFDRAGYWAWITAAIPQPMGQGCSKRHGSLEMPALRAEGEIRDERFWPERGKNQGIGHTSAAGSYRKADSKLRGQAVPKANGVDHGDRADG